MNKIEFSCNKCFRVEQILHNNETVGTQVCLAVDDELKRRVVIKTMHFNDREQKRLILEEITNQTTLEQYSDYVPKIYNFIIDGKKSQAIIEMQHIEGKSLRTIIDSASKMKKDKIWYDRQYTLFMDVVKAVSYIHNLNGFVHKDIKPENIVVISKRNAVYILDYGTSGLGTIDKGVGTAKYMAPEQISRANTNFVYQSTDVFALAQVALEMFGYDTIEYGVDAVPDRVGNTWMEFKDISKIGADFYPELSTILKKALSLNPKDRYENARAFYEALNKGRRAGHGNRFQGKPNSKRPAKSH